MQPLPFRRPQSWHVRRSAGAARRSGSCQHRRRTPGSFRAIRGAISSKSAITARHEALKTSRCSDPRLRPGTPQAPKRPDATTLQPIKALQDLVPGPVACRPQQPFGKKVDLRDTRPASAFSPASSTHLGASFRPCCGSAGLDGGPQI